MFELFSDFGWEWEPHLPNTPLTNVEDTRFFLLMMASTASGGTSPSLSPRMTIGDLLRVNDDRLSAEKEIGVRRRGLLRRVRCRGDPPDRARGSVTNSTFF